MKYYLLYLGYGHLFSIQKKKFATKPIMVQIMFLYFFAHNKRLCYKVIKNIEIIIYCLSLQD